MVVKRCHESQARIVLLGGNIIISSLKQHVLATNPQLTQVKTNTPRSEHFTIYVWCIWRLTDVTYMPACAQQSPRLCTM